MKDGQLRHLIEVLENRKDVLDRQSKDTWNEEHSSSCKAKAVELEYVLNLLDSLEKEMLFDPNNPDGGSRR